MNDPTQARGAPPPPPPAAQAKPAVKFQRGGAGAPAAPPRLVIMGVEGWGKTTLGAHAPEPAIIMARGETGYLTLNAAGLAPDADCVEVISWPETLAAVQDAALSHKTIVLDALGGFERLCQEFVCQRDFRGDWGETGFAAYQRGHERVAMEWLALLAALERARRDHGCAILLLSHVVVRTYRNPMGLDYDRYESDLHRKTWAPTHQWADAVLFGNFLSRVEPAGGGRKGKGMGAADRVLYTERRDAYDAKNRFDMPECVLMPDDPTKTFDTLKGAIKSWR